MPAPDPAALDAARDLCRFIDASPSPYHCVATAIERLREAGFAPAGSGAAPPAPAAGYYASRGGTLVAWRAPAGFDRFLVVGAHTDSPNLRVKPRPDHGKAGYRQLGVEVYGGALLNSWLDRDLGLCGRVAVRGRGLALVRIDRPVLRIPQLAIHLDREINEKGLLLNRQQHLSPFWALASSGDGAEDDPTFRAVLAGEVGCASEDVLSWEIMVHPLQASTLGGLADEFVNAPRIDNQLSCWAGVEALCGRARSSGDDDSPAHAEVLVLFDHEEVGSTSDRGADGAFLASLLERVSAAAGLDRVAHLEALARSHCVSSDCAHATNPNYADRHEPEHTIALNAGPVLKLNANLRYATDAASSAPVVAAAERAGVPLQWFVNRTDLACGSTIGPLTAAALGVATIDVGAPQLAMHSSRELCGSADPAMLRDLLASYWTGRDSGEEWLT
ncbi:MAG: M18 family aminopeptidase [Acidimicrobiia bacterium]|nr:M18 family aminopeptidase [Acidimicrobiia bacterium]